MTINGEVILSGDEQTNEGFILSIDSQELLVFEDQPGAEVAYFGPLVLGLNPGNHTLELRHTNTLDETESLESVHLTIELIFVPD